MHLRERDVEQLKLIVRHIEKIQRYVSRFGDSFLDFESNEDYRDLCYYALVQIGESVHSLSEDFTHEHEEMPWEEIYGMRCYLVHGYDNVSARVIWAVIAHDIRSLCDFALISWVRCRHKPIVASSERYGM